MTSRPCSECAHSFNPYKGQSLWRVIFSPPRITMFDTVCKHPDCRDDVTGEPMPCVSMRLNRCNGTAPMFVEKRNNAAASEVA